MCKKDGRFENHSLHFIISITVQTKGKQFSNTAAQVGRPAPDKGKDISPAPDKPAANLSNIKPQKPLKPLLYRLGFGQYFMQRS
jgi:hypothetical protein